MDEAKYIRQQCFNTNTICCDMQTEDTRSWDNRTTDVITTTMQPLTIKTENIITTSKKSCNFVDSPAKKIPHFLNDGSLISNGGCSRTNPVSWTATVPSIGGTLVQVKREPQGESHQGMMPIKLEQNSPSAKQSDHLSVATTIAGSVNNGSIPVGIAVARQRLPHELGGGGGVLSTAPPSSGKDQQSLSRFPDIDAVGGTLGGLEDAPPPWPLPQHQAPPAAWQYPPQVTVEPCMGGLQLVRDSGPGGLQLLRDSGPGGLQLLRDSGPGGLQLLRDPGPGGLQLVRDPGSGGLQLVREPPSTGLQLVRDPANGALLLLPPAYLQPPAPAPQQQLQPQHVHDMWQQEQFQQAVFLGGYGGVGAGVFLPPLPPPLAPMQLLGAELLTASTTLHHTTHQTHHSTRLVALAAEPKARLPPRDQGFLLYQLDCRERPPSPAGSAPGPPPAPASPPLPEVQDASNQTDTPTPSEEEELNSNHAAECASEDIKHIIIPRPLRDQVDNTIRITSVGDNNLQITPMLFTNSSVQTKREPKTPGIEQFNGLDSVDIDASPTEPPNHESDKGACIRVTLQQDATVNSPEESESSGIPEVNANTAVVVESEKLSDSNSSEVNNVPVVAVNDPNPVPDTFQKPDAPPPQIKVVEVLQLQKPSIQVDLSGLELLSNSIEQYVTRSNSMESPSIKAPLLHMPSLADHNPSTSTLTVDVQNTLQPPPAVIIKTSPMSPKCVPEAETSHFNFPPTNSFQSNICDDNGSLRGLGLLCALAEQRFMEEEEERKSEHGSVSTVSTNEENTQDEIILPNIKTEKHDKYYSDGFLKVHEYGKMNQDSAKAKSSRSSDPRMPIEKELKKEFGSAKNNFLNRETKGGFENLDKCKELLTAMKSFADRKSFDKHKKDQSSDNRMEKRRLSEKSRTSSISTTDATDLLESLDKSYKKFEKCACKEEPHTCKERAKWLDSMSAMELDMIVRLADLKRQYNEKQRELSKLTPKKSPEDPFKRGPGRPRKKSTASDRAGSPTCDVANSLNFRNKPISGIFTSSTDSPAEDSSKGADRIPSLIKLSEDENSNLNDSQDSQSRSFSPIADSNSSQSSVATLSSSKKRKVGRPKKLLSTPGSRVATETIVAKKPKSKSSLVGYLLAAKSRFNLPPSKGGIIYSKTNPPRPCEDESANKRNSAKNYKGQKLKTNIKPSENNCYSSPASSVSEYKYPVGYDVKQKYASLLSDTNTGSKMRPKLKAEPKLKEYSEEDDVNNDWCGSQSNLTDVKSQSSSMESLQEVHLKNKQKTDQLALKHKKSVVPKQSNPKKRDLQSMYDTSDSEHESPPKKRRPSKSEPKTPASKVNTEKNNQTNKCTKKKMDFKDHYDASDSENDDQVKKASEVVAATKVEPADVLVKSVDRGRCTLMLDELGGGDVRVLTAMGGLFYAGSLRAVRAPDVYAVTLDGERGNRPHILSREEALRDAILEVFPTSTSELLPGTRLCAYWSQQYRCLYPGTVAEPSTPDPLTDHKFVSVEFDDGDSGRIALEDIRLLQPDYPIVEYDLNPLLTLSKRRRQTSVNSTDDKKVNTCLNTITSTELNNSGGQLAPKIGNGLGTFVSTSKQSQLEAEFSHRERKRLKKHKREKLKKMLSRSGDENSNVEDLIRKKKKKHKCCDDHCKHRKHHKKHHKKHKRHHHSSSKEHSGSSSEDPTRSAMLATAFNQSPFFAIKDVSVDLSSSMDVTSTNASQASEDVAKAGGAKTNTKKKPLIKKTLLTKSMKINKGKKITVTDVVERNGCLEFATNVAASDAENLGGPLVKKIKITNTNGKKSDKDNLKDSGIGIDNDDATADADHDEESDSAFNEANESEVKKAIKKGKKRSSSSTSECGGSKMAAFLPAGAQLWGWRGTGHRRPQARGRARKCFYRAIQRGAEVINVGDSAVFLSTGRPDRPYIGQVESLWEGWQGGMTVRVRWYYHPEETIGCPGTLATPGGLFESPHTDENDVQTISHRCEVLSLAGYELRLSSQPQKCDSNDTYYLAGHYDPTHQTLRMEPHIPFAAE